MGRPLACVIIGNGIAGVTAAEKLRVSDPTCSITIVADEFFPVYYRPALKDHLAGRVHEDRLWARPTTFYQHLRIRFVSGHVVRIASAQQTLYLQNGETIVYDRLLLACGARSRQLSCPGSQLSGVTTLRTLTDYQHVLQRLSHARRVLVYGAGTLALETAETLCHQGYEVTHLLRHSTLWSEVLDKTASDLVLQEERRLGITLRLEEEIVQIVGAGGQVSEVITTRGTHIPCDLVLVAIGIEPLIDFARAAGVVGERGVQVDAQMRTNIANIYAAGDITEIKESITGRTRVVGQWYPAIQQAQIAALSMVGRLDEQSASVAVFNQSNFYNATFLCGLDFVSIGITLVPAHPTLQVLVAEPQARTYRKLVLWQGVPIGLLWLGQREGALAYKRAIDHHVDLTPVLKRIFSPDFALDAWLDQQGVPPAIVGVDTLFPSHDDATTATSQRAELVHIPHPAVSVVLPASSFMLEREQSIVTLGRQQDASLCIDHASVSRWHAELASVHDQSGQHYLLRDVGSSNGTFVNNSRLAPNAVHSLRQHDLIRFGDVQFSFQLPETSFDQPMIPVVGTSHREDLRPLSKERVHFEIDMCIGCDRCMAACPVPLSSQVSIADLNQATLSPQFNSQIERFTHECILCGSCVPVCPVDNHRDLLMLTLKQHLGHVWDRPVDQGRLQQVVPPGWSLPQLINALQAQRVLGDSERVLEQYLLHLLAASQLLMPSASTVIVREGAYDRNLYLILDGQVAVSAFDVSGRELPVAILRPGEMIGEHSLLTGQPATATARTQTSALLLQVPEQVMQHLLELVPGMRAFFEQSSVSYAVKASLQRMALFQGLGDDAIDYLIAQARVRYVDRGENLFSEDGVGRPVRETVHILLEGFVKVTRHKVPEDAQTASERVIAYRQSGDYFLGGLDLLGDGRAVTVAAINRVHVAQVPQVVIQALFQRYPEFEHRFDQRSREYMSSALSARTGTMPMLGARQTQVVDAPLADGARKAMLHTLVDDGVVEGTEVLVIDLDACIHCAECEEACAQRHGHSRINRKGPVLENLSVVTACRQCQDPVCMLCSRAGIARLPDGEVYITDSCIGCGICAERCPYGAISIVDVSEPAAEVEQSSWQRFSNIFRHGLIKEKQRPVLPVLNESVARASNRRVAPGPLAVQQSYSGYAELRKKLAIKCDLCAGYKDQACVKACPTGAAFRVRPTAFFGSTEQILQHQARHDG